jgi:hypothetical protein
VVTSDRKSKRTKRIKANISGSRGSSASTWGCRWRFLRAGLASLATPPGKDRSLAAASRAGTAAIDDLARPAGLAA